MAAAGSGSGREALRGALVTSAWTLVSRIAGYARDALLAAVFGMSPLLGALNMAWMVPNLFRRLFGEGAVAAAIQPALARAEHAGGSAQAHEIFSRFHGLLLQLLGAIVLAGGLGLFAAWILLPATADWQETRRAILFSLVLLPYVLPICLAALHSSPQNLRGYFFLPALGPVTLNLFWIAALLWPLPEEATDSHRAAVVMTAILLGGLAQWLMQLPGLRASGYPAAPRFGRLPPEIRRALRDFAPALLGLAAVQMAAVVDQVIVRWLVDSSANSYSYYANRLLHLPLALVGLSAATGVMPLLARKAAERDLAGLAEVMRRGTQTLFLLIFAAAAGMYAVAEPVVRSLFERGEFTADDTQLLAATLRAYLWSLPPAALGALLVRAYLACGQYRYQAIAAVLVVPVNLAGDLLLVPHYGVPGAGWATAFALLAQCLMLIGGLPQLGLPARLFRPRDFLLLILPGFAAYGAARAALLPFGGSAAGLSGLCAAIAAGVAAALVACALLRPDDFRQLARALRRKKS
jgi:putative peptidoglycan lipid II flippase